MVYSTNFNGAGNDTEIHLFSNNLGFCMFSKVTPSSMYIWKYLFSEVDSADWQQIATNIRNPYGSLTINNNQYFIIGVDSISPYTIHFYKVLFGSSSVDWANQILWTEGSCSNGLSESLLSTDGSLIYSFFIFGNAPNMYFAIFNSSGGQSVGSIYKSSATWTGVCGSIQIDIYIFVTSSWTNFYLMRLNKLTYEFVVFSTSSNFVLYFISQDYISGR